MDTDINPIFSFLPDVINTFYTLNIVMTQTQRTGPPNVMKITFDFAFDDYQVNFNRSYEKIDQLLANIFSVTDTFLFVGGICAMFFNYGHFEQEIMKYLYNFEKNDVNLSPNSELRIFKNRNSEYKKSSH